MEKLLQSFVILLFFCFNLLNAQVYVVFDKNGQINQQHENLEIPLKKGNVIDKGTVVVKDNTAEITFIDQNGATFKIENQGRYKIQDIGQYEEMKEHKNFTKQYLSYVWNEISGNSENYTHTANVYRSTYPNVLEFPKDSTTIYGKAVSFEWQHPKSEDGIYLFLLNESSGKLTKFFLKGTTFSLFVDSNLLIEGHQYKWFVSENKFPDFNNLDSGQFLFLNEQEYFNKKATIIETDPFLSKHQLSDVETNDFICRFYNQCLVN